MKSHTTSRFRKAYEHLPERIQHQAKEAYSLFKKNHRHPSLRYKKVHPKKPIYSVRISQSYRALGIQDGNEMIWFWIGSHEEYERMISRGL